MNQESILGSLTVVVDNGSDETHQPYVACNQGFAASEHGLLRMLNPYPPGREQDWWFMGYDESEDQRDNDGEYNDPETPPSIGLSR